MQKERLTERVREIIATIFDVPQEAVTELSSPDTIERWDSLGRLVLTVELEQEFGVDVPPERTELLTSVAAIVEWLATQSVATTRAETTWA